ncbi:hypothetical protein [Methylomonas sp. CM2]|uniref:hypothetical protein n=1 Tax=Methylomonas sp. CM2 TaxID=3417647 RepID=UPI003CE9C44D
MFELVAETLPFGRITFSKKLDGFVGELETRIAEFGTSVVAFQTASGGMNPPR